MLQGAAAAGAEMRAGGRLAVRRGRENVCAARPALATSDQACGSDLFTRQSEREVALAPIGKRRKAVAIGADPLDGQILRSLLAMPSPGGRGLLGEAAIRAQAPNADSPVCDRPRMRACTSCVPS